MQCFLRDGWSAELEGPHLRGHDHGRRGLWKKGGGSPRSFLEEGSQRWRDMRETGS